MSKSNIPIPPKVKLDGESNDNNADVDDEEKQASRVELNDVKNTNEMIITNSTLKQRNVSVEPPIIRRDSYNRGNFVTGINSYNNTKYGMVNPISGLTTQDFNPITGRKEMPTIMAATGIISSDPNKYTKFNSRMGESALNFANENTLRQTTTNAYAGLGVPVLK